MEKKKKPPPSRLDAFLPFLKFIWFGLAIGLWAAEQFLHATKGTPLSGMVFLKGLVLLTEAAFLYGLSGFKRFYFLGMFPLSWLAVSRFQWDLCSFPISRFWAWLALFLAMEILILALPDGKKLLGPLAALWGGLIWLFKFSFLLPLAFLTAPERRFKRAPWVRWGGLAAGLVFYLAFRGWGYFQFSFLDLYDFFIDKGFLAFFLLGWLGMIAYDARTKGPFRHTVAPIFLLSLGYMGWGGRSPASLEEGELLQWILLLMAGFGWEAFRKYMMDESWHGRLVWFTLGLCFFGGVF